MDYRLMKAFGWIEGHAHKRLAKGEVLSNGKDDALIAKLFRMGAQLEPVEVKEEPKGKTK
jgi:hypothetical protein